MRQVITGHAHETAPVVFILNPRELRKYLAHCPVVMAGCHCQRHICERAARAHYQPASCVEAEIPQQVPRIRGGLTPREDGLTELFRDGLSSDLKGRYGYE